MDRIDIMKQFCVGIFAGFFLKNERKNKKKGKKKKKKVTALFFGFSKINTNKKKGRVKKGSELLWPTGFLKTPPFGSGPGSYLTKKGIEKREREREKKKGGKTFPLSCSPLPQHPLLRMP